MRENAAFVDAAFSLKNSNWLPSKAGAPVTFSELTLQKRSWGLFFQVPTGYQRSPGGAPVAPADSSYRLRGLSGDQRCAASPRTVC